MSSSLQRCHYEVLGVERTATEDEIKKAYRVQALKNHPDKAASRGEDTEKAHTKFQEIQAAYECLSDSRERAWYDSHREDILQGGECGETSEDETTSDRIARREVNLWPYFSATVYEGYSGPRSFYVVYQEAFEKVAQAERRGVPEYETPSFGDADSEWDLVKAFYDEFIDFQSPRSFASYDRWKTDSETPRHVRRAADADNKRHRKAAKQEYQEMVRQLAQYCRKRDPRVAKRIAEVAAEKEAKEKAAILEKSKQRARHLEARQKWREEQANSPETNSYHVRTGALLADLEDDDTYSSSRRGKGRRSKNNSKDTSLQTDPSHQIDQATPSCQPVVDPDTENEEVTPLQSALEQNEEAIDAPLSSDSEEDEEDLVFACSICKKTFKSDKQLENHLQSKAHKKKAASAKR